METKQPAKARQDAHPASRANAWRVLVAAAALVAVVAGLRAASVLVVPFLLAIFLAIICSPLLFWLRQKGVGTPVAVSIAVFVLLGFTLLAIFLVGTSLNDFISRLPAYEQRLQVRTEALAALLQDRGLDVNRDLIMEYFNPGLAMRMVGNTLTGLAGVFTQGFFILLMVVFILTEASTFPAKLRAAVRNPDASLAGITQFITSFNRFLAIKTGISLATGVSAGVGLVLLGVDFPVLWGLLAFLLNYVPNIGSLIAAVPPILLALVQFGPGRAILVGVLFLFINTLFGNVLEPRIMGRGLGLSPLVVFLSLVVWGWVLGPVGMLLSVPLTMILKIGLASHRDTRWISILLGSDSSGPATEDNGKST